MKTSFRVVIIFLLVFLIHSCKKEVDNVIKDIDGNTYKSVTIGKQVWMVENLKTTKYDNGDLIGTTNPATLDISSELAPKYQWAYYGDESNVNAYGRLYTWYAVTDTRNVCPTGWHVPTDAEWTTLTTYLGGDSVAGGKLKETGTTHWINTYTEVTNSSRFTALPGGNCWGVITEPLSYFGDLGYAGHFWSTSEYHNSINGFYGAYIRTFIGGFEEYTNQTFTKTQGLSIRCIQDSI
jgi:uncharacterized protein (TIGR02145 family)